MKNQRKRISIFEQFRAAQRLSSAMEMGGGVQSSDLEILGLPASFARHFSR
jgi:hypothetical protein